MGKILPTQMLDLPAKGGYIPPIPGLHKDNSCWNKFIFENSLKNTTTIFQVQPYRGGEMGQDIDAVETEIWDSVIRGAVKMRSNNSNRLPIHLPVRYCVDHY